MDSLAASSGFGLLVETLADLRDEGKSIDEVYDFVEKNKLNLQSWFFSTDLTFYVRGGRVSKASGFVGNMLGICPLLNINYEGKLIPREKIRGKKKAVRRTVEKMLEHAQDGADYSGKCYISQSASLDTAKELAEQIEAAFPKLNGKVEIYNIGTTIGSHTGPGTIATFFWGDQRVD